MELRPVDRPAQSLLYGWLTAPDAAPWLDFGHTGALGSPLHLQMMLERRTNYVRLFAPEPGGPPAGVVAFANIHQTFASAMLWYALGERSLGGRGLATRAVAELLAVGFGELGLETIHSWSVDGNTASRRVLERNGFRLIGRQRRCHRLEGRLVDRLLFDLVRDEFRPASFD